MHSFIQFVVILSFELYLNTLSKEIYSCIYYYRKETEVCSKYSFVFWKLLVKKIIKNNKSRLLFHFVQNKWIGGDVYWAKKIQVLLFSTTPSNRNNTDCGWSISKTAMKNFKEVRFHLLLESI